MRTRLALVAGVALLGSGAAFVAASPQSAQQAAAASMVVYKSAT
jgi:hypothetical protein